MITTFLHKKYVVAVLSLALLVMTMFVSLQYTPKAHAQTTKSNVATTILVQGGFSCYYHQFVNVWIQSSGGGSKFADIIGQSSPSRYDGIYAVSIVTTLPTRIQLHVGCGGSKWSWWSDNWTPYTTVTSNVNLSGNCNDTQHAYGANQRCWYGESTAQDGAISWAKKFITNPPTDAYANECLKFDFKAYEQQSFNVRQWVNYPIGDNTYPSDIWKKFNYGLQGGADPYPPAGALVFFLPKPGVSKIYSHVELSTGGGMMISTDDHFSHTVHWETLDQHLHSGSWNYYAGWWLFA